MADVIMWPDQSRRDEERKERAERLAEARALAKACMAQLDELEAAAKTWRVRPDHLEGIYLRNFLASFRTFSALASVLPTLIEGLEASGEAQLLEVRNQTTKMYESILIFQRFVGTLQGDYDRGKLLGIERAVNQAVTSLVTQLGRSIQELTKVPPKREFKIDRAWWVVAASIGALFAFYLFTSMMGSVYRGDAQQLAAGFKACSYNKVASGKIIYCPLRDFQGNPTGAAPGFPSNNKPVKEPTPGYGGMRY